MLRASYLADDGKERNVWTGTESSFYISDDPNGERFFINRTRVKREEFLRRRQTECQHVPDYFERFCRNCSLTLEKRIGSVPLPLPEFVLRIIPITEPLIAQLRYRLIMKAGGQEADLGPVTEIRMENGMTTFTLKSGGKITVDEPFKMENTPK